MWFKNLRIFRLDPRFDVSAQELSAMLNEERFTSCGSQEPLSLGWVPPREGGGLIHEVNGQYLICMRAERKLLPSAVVNQAAREKAREIEEQQGYKPGRKQMKEIKEQIIIDLMPRSHAVQRDTKVWIDTRNHWFVIDTAAVAKSDEVLGLFAKSVEPFPVLPLYTEWSPAGAMTAWLVDEEQLANFTVDQDTELRSTGDSGATVRYVKQSADIDEVRKHVEAGKQCTRLAMTWADRISFVLTDALDVKRVAPLDILTEKQDVPAVNDNEIFDADMTLMTSELAKMISDLVVTLGGERSS
ncbi:recombination-associated protein RdgC [Alcaligenes faecalis]|uniref:recombination-associated protein RdgC n=1 Tax=Alcaligenes faecalis TaxID=511 RepID=UPI0005A8C842|nr:recombination-associated protein RdgC [Alcaligenes faecalis]ATI00011.1 recombination-associated protein RdgC [Alcaligenes faecalis]AYZ92797.1 recombination-associated protein RdgC [Alcaligenes faecalis]MCX5593566.1 recombination-associated protein RdgC [Alcaligenes faecalis]QQC31398.1 recombination-associated protein RdgC [Alcaligenes faecalis]CAJ0905715.1 Recombination-associated protein RdgC [Alcaligenes faecalis subsp. faecalis]